MPPETKSVIPAVFYRTLSVEGLEIFYREAGPRDAPTVLLLHVSPGAPAFSMGYRYLTRTIEVLRQFLQQLGCFGRVFHTQNLFHLVCRLLPDGIEQLAVHGDLDGGVAQRFLDRLGMHACADQQSSGAVAQIIIPNPASAGTVAEPFEDPVHAALLQRRSDSRYERTRQRPSTRSLPDAALPLA